MNKPKVAAGAMAKHELYREAGRSSNTQVTYINAVNHFRDIWGGLLPAAPGAIAQYLADHAGKLKVSTLRLRLAALSKWHVSQGFPDPTKAVEVQEVIRGIAKIHNTSPEQATPFEFRHLKAVCDNLAEQKAVAVAAGADRATLLTIQRDLALILVGFWQAFRSDELSRLAVQDIEFNGNAGMSIYIRASKTDVYATGRKATQQYLREYCPVIAVRDLLEMTGLKEGPLFRKVERNGKLAQRSMNKRSVEWIVRKVSEGLFDDEPHFTAHSLRRGFAHWAIEQNWDEKTIMEHVGWKSLENARRYMPTRKHYGHLDMSLPSEMLGATGRLGGVGGETILADYRVLVDED